MKIILAPFGSRGDVDPMLALGHALRGRGHSVVLCAPTNFRQHVQKHGFDFHSGGPDFRSYFDGTQNEAKVLWRVFRDAPAQFESLEKACTDADAVVGSMLQLAAPSLAEVLDIPYFYAVFSPAYLRSTRLPPLGVPWRRVPELFHRALWLTQDALVPLLARPLIRQRRKLGLSPPSSIYEYLARSGELLVASDPVLTPVPDDAGPHHLTGVWRFPENGELTPELTEFLESGPAPLYFGFGSMVQRNPQRVVDLLVEATHRSGQRAVIAAGWSRISAVATDSCHMVGKVPHDELFSRVKLVVHHGGAGTTAAAALAGIPQIVVPHLGDQYYHGFRVEELGLGPSPLPFRRLSPARLAEAIRSVLSNDRFAARAQDFAECPCVRVMARGTRQHSSKNGQQEATAPAPDPFKRVKGTTTLRPRPKPSAGTPRNGVPAVTFRTCPGLPGRRLRATS